MNLQKEQYANGLFVRFSDKINPLTGKSGALAFKCKTGNIPGVQIYRRHNDRARKTEMKTFTLVIAVASILSIIISENGFHPVSSGAAEKAASADAGKTAPDPHLASDIKAAIPKMNPEKSKTKKTAAIKKKKTTKKKTAAKKADSGKKTAKKADAAGKRAEAKNAPEQLTTVEVVKLLKTTREFAGKNMSGLQLVGVDLSRSNLKGSDLSNANLERADLGEANLERAKLNGANLRMANFRLAGINAAELDGSTLDGAIWIDGRICAKGSSGRCVDNFQPLGPVGGFMTPVPDVR